MVNNDRIFPLVLTQTDVFLICADISNKWSFDHIKSKWYIEADHYSPNTPMFIIGCKQDLRIDLDKLFHGFIIQMQFKYEIIIPSDVFDLIRKYHSWAYLHKEQEPTDELIAEKYAHELTKEIDAYKYMECSALHINGINEIFVEICRGFINNWEIKQAYYSTKCGTCLLL